MQKYKELSTDFSKKPTIDVQVVDNNLSFFLEIFIYSEFTSI